MVFVVSPLAIVAERLPCVILILPYCAGKITSKSSGDCTKALVKLLVAFYAHNGKIICQLINKTV